MVKTRRYTPPTPGTKLASFIFPFVTLWLGFGYLFSPYSRLHAPAYQAATTLMPMHWWGALFIVFGLMKVGFLLFSGDNPVPLMMAMCAGMGLYTMWAIFIFAAMLINDQTSYGAPALSFGWAFMHVAYMATIRAISRT